MNRDEKQKILARMTAALDTALDERKKDLRRTADILRQDRVFAADSGINTREFQQRRLAAETRNMIRPGFVATDKNTFDHGVKRSEAYEKRPSTRALKGRRERMDREKKELLERMKTAMKRGRNARIMDRYSEADQIQEGIEHQDEYRLGKALDRASARNMLIKGLADNHRGQAIEVSTAEIEGTETAKRPSTRALRKHREKEIDSGRSM